jgi:hypothetical protein
MKEKIVISVLLFLSIFCFYFGISLIIDEGMNYMIIGVFSGAIVMLCLASAPEDIFKSLFGKTKVNNTNVSKWLYKLFWTMYSIFMILYIIDTYYIKT